MRKKINDNAHIQKNYLSKMIFLDVLSDIFARILFFRKIYR